VIMTESKWLDCGNPLAMLEHLGASSEARRSKLRLFACACCRRIWHLIPERGRRAVEVAERFADGLVGPDELRSAWRGVSPFDGETDRRGEAALFAAWGASWPVPRTGGGPSAFTAAWNASIGAAEGAEQAEILHDIIGNPFFPPQIHAGLLTPDVVTLAGHIDHDRAFALLPELADMLEESGCADDTLLSHLRSPGPHVRGCWALDLVLGKE
jgi:hypothetical protein